MAIVGGGVSGTLVAAHLLRDATSEGRGLHVVLVDKQAAFGEGPAYRTPDPRHLLNVPAGKMSAWPDRPDDFLTWARMRDPRVASDDFLPRRTYGEYVRATLFEVANGVGPGVTMEIRQDDARAISWDEDGRWRLAQGSGTAPIEAAAVVLATGHRLPSDPLPGRWRGPRSRFVSDPWASLTLSTIGPDEPVILLGSGLTAIDVLLTLTRERRTAKVIAVSRRGLLPRAHADAPVVPADLSGRVQELLSRPGGLTVRGLLRVLRDEAANGAEWRAIVDGLRPHTAKLWGNLSTAEAARFLRHVRGFWEVHRHRMAPSIARSVEEHQAAGLFRVLAGRVSAAEGEDEGVTLEVKLRGTMARERLRSAWVVNCTGPGDQGSGLAPPMSSLIEAGHLQADPLGLGVLTGPLGEAIGRAGVRRDLIVIGTLRKPGLWESTAVPELRGQAASAASLLLEQLG